MVRNQLCFHLHCLCEFIQWSQFFCCPGWNLGQVPRLSRSFLGNADSLSSVITVCSPVHHYTFKAHPAKASPALALPVAGGTRVVDTFGLFSLSLLCQSSSDRKHVALQSWEDEGSFVKGLSPKVVARLVGTRGRSY